MNPESLSAEQQWNEALVELRNHLAGVREALDDGDLDNIKPFSVPDGLPGMPTACVADAQSLMDEQQQVEVALRHALEEHRPTQQRPPQSAVGFRRSRFEARA